MIVAMHATKVVVRDVEAAERFYAAIGLKLVNRNLGGEGNVRQQQSWMSVTGDSTSHMLILSQFTEIPTPPRPDYPGEFWLAFNVADVDAICDAVTREGGSILRPGEDRPEHGVRAAVVADPEGHIIEIVGPIGGAGGTVEDPLASRSGDGA
ncbi:MAG: VOC family protein [Novosphingobium sp.]|nr:VOC family protein [Novosphingobium sp.]